MVEYIITQCPMCHEMEFSWFDGRVYRWCKAHKQGITGIGSLTKPRKNWCKEYNHPKGSKKRAKYISEAKFRMRYPT